MRCISKFGSNHMLPNHSVVKEPGSFLTESSMQLLRTGSDEIPNSTEVVEVSGIEPLTPCLQSRCSPS